MEGRDQHHDHGLAHGHRIRALADRLLHLGCKPQLRDASKKQECVINIPTEDIAAKVVGIGNSSGRDIDKFKKFSLTAAPSRRSMPRSLRNATPISNAGWRIPASSTSTVCLSGRSLRRTQRHPLVIRALFIIAAMVFSCCLMATPADIAASSNRKICKSFIDQERWTEVDRYITEHVLPADPALEAALEASDAAGLPAIQVSPNMGKLLQLLAQAARARDPRDWRPRRLQHNLACTCSYAGRPRGHT